MNVTKTVNETLESQEYQESYKGFNILVYQRGYKEFVYITTDVNQTILVIDDGHCCIEDATEEAKESIDRMIENQN